MTQHCAGEIPLSDKTLCNSLFSISSNEKWIFGSLCLLVCVLFLFCLFFAPTVDTELLWLKLRHPSYTVSSSSCPESGFRFEPFIIIIAFTIVVWFFPVSSSPFKVWFLPKLFIKSSFSVNLFLYNSWVLSITLRPLPGLEASRPGLG